MKVHKNFSVFLVSFFTLFLFVTEGYSYTINASAGPGGSISPSGAVTVNPGTDQTFTITPDVDYGVFDVIMDSSSVGPTLSYTFNNVSADHSIEASFAACDYLFPVLLQEYDSLFGTITEAYDYASLTLLLNDFTLMLIEGTLAQEDMNFDQDVSVLLEGGYDCSFLESSLITAIPGSLTITAGTVSPSNIVLSAPPSCEPGDPINFPGNPEVCDGLDNNCNGIVDDGLSTDADSDGHYAFDSCFTPADDCDDNDPSNFPGNPEICDGFDNDCDSEIDEGLTATDADGDDHTSIGSCGGTADDCNDNNPGIYPDALEIPADGIDQDCNGQDLTFSETNCFGCHGSVGAVNNIHTSVAAPDGTCAACHTASVSNVLPGHYGKTVRTSGNNMTAGSIIGCISCHDWHDPAEYDVGNANIVWAKVGADWPNVTCDTCHENRAAVHVTGTAHNNRLIDSACGQCHTSDTSVLGSPGTGTLATQADVDTLHRSDCNLCHNYTGTKLDAAAVAQAIQNGLDGIPITCTHCHFDKTTGHGSVDHVSYGYVTGGATSCMNCHDPGGAANATVDVTHNGNCTLCHTTIPNLQPGIPAGGGDCVTCHTDPFDIIHAAHAHTVEQGAGDLSDGVSCGACHVVANWGEIEGVEHNVATNGAGSCATCHNSPRQAVIDAIALGANPTNCLDCHSDKTEAHGVPTSGQHTVHLTLTGISCTTCHENGNIPYFKSGTDLNGDGLYDFSETNVCDACHQDATGNPVQGIKDGWNDPGFTLDCSGCHASAPVSGSHTSHLSLSGCGNCHDGTVADTTAPVQHLDGNIDVYDNAPFDLGYPVDKEIGSAYATCSNTYCHSSAQGITDPTDLPVYATTHVWGTPFGGTEATCTGCHDSGGHVGDASSPLATGSHAKHLNFRFDQDATCNACHFDWSYTGCTTCHQRQVNHVNNSIDVMFKPDFPMSAASSSGAYTGNPAPRTPYGSCSALYCHSPGTRASAPYDDPNQTNISWGGSGLPADCTGCHNGDSATALAMATGSHGTHIVNYDCSKCHARTVDNSRSLNSTVYTPKNYTWGQRYHVDGWVTVAFSSDIATSGTYAETASPTFYRAPGSLAGACANTYCHSDGTSVSTTVIPDNLTPDWGTGSLTCDSCHAYAPEYGNGTPKANSHTAHSGYSCNTCHFSTTSTGNTITNGANHANQIYDVQAGNGASFSYNFDSAGGTCSNISCHGGTDAVWGIPLAGGCSSCHGNPPDYPNGSPKVNSHSKHNEYNYSCAECHFATTNDGLTITDRSLHANGVMDVTFSDPTMTYNPGSHTCSNTYCHSNGMAVEGMTPESTSVQTPAPIYERTIQPNTSPAWGGGLLSCISCHDVMDEQDIYPNIIAGGPGYPDSYPALQYKATSHGRHQFLGCNGCHYNTTNDGVTISNTTSHVNGVYDLVPDPSLVASIGYAYDAGGGSCAAQCHTFNYHQGYLYRWGYNTLSASRAPYLGSNNQVTLDLSRGSNYGEIQGPYAYYIEWGDGSSETVFGKGGHMDGPGAWHQYADSTSKTVKIWIRDSINHLSLRSTDYTYSSLQNGCGNGWYNTRVVPNHSYEVNGYEVTITDLSVDPDYFCERPSNYAGDFGLVTINWGDGTVESFEVRLTDDPNEPQGAWGTTKTFSHTYAAPFSGTITYGVEDNFHYYGGTSYPPMNMDLTDMVVPQ